CNAVQVGNGGREKKERGEHEKDVLGHFDWPIFLIKAVPAEEKRRLCGNDRDDGYRKIQVEMSAEVCLRDQQTFIPSVPAAKQPFIETRYDQHCKRLRPV